MKILGGICRRLYVMGFRPDARSIFYSPSLSLTMGVQPLWRQKMHESTKKEEADVFGFGKGKLGRHRIDSEEAQTPAPRDPWDLGQDGFRVVNFSSAIDRHAMVLGQEYVAKTHMSRVKFCPICGGGLMATLRDSRGEYEKTCPFGHGFASMDKSGQADLPAVIFEIL